MSGAALVWAANVRGIAPAPKIVLIQLAERHNKDTGICNPSITKLSDDCEMSRASVLRHLKELETVGLITRVARGHDSGGRASSQYNLHMDRGEKSQYETGGKSLNSSREKSQIEGGKSLNSETPYIEPVLNPKEPERVRAEGFFEEDQIPEISPEERAVSDFNAMAEKNGWSKCQKLSDQRKKKLKARLKDCDGIEGWRFVLDRCAKSDFLMGRTSHKFVLGIDFLLQESSFTKVMEGFYGLDDKEPEKRERGQSYMDRARSIIAGQA